MHVHAEMLSSLQVIQEKSDGGANQDYLTVKADLRTRGNAFGAETGAGIESSVYGAVCVPGKDSASIMM